MDKSNPYQQSKRSSNAPRVAATAGAVAAGAGAAYAVSTKLSNGGEEVDDNVPSVEETSIEVISDRSLEDSAEDVQNPVVGQTGSTAVYDEFVPEIDVQPEPDPLPGPGIDPEPEPYPEPDPLPGPDIDPDPEPDVILDPEPDIDLESYSFDVIS